jgi:hypothetical protein
LSKDGPQKERQSRGGFDIAPLWLIQQRYRENEELHRALGETGYNVLLTETESLIKRNNALPAPHWRELCKAIKAIASKWTRTHLHILTRGRHPPNEVCALSDAEVADRLAQIYTRGTRLIEAMRGTPLLYAQHTGDREGLVYHLRSGLPLSREIREYAADIIEGKVTPRAANRPRRQETDRRNRAITWSILDMREGGTGDDASIDKAADEFGLGRRTIQKIFSEYRDAETVFLAESRELLKQLQTLHKDMVGRTEVRT